MPRPILRAALPAALLAAALFAPATARAAGELLLYTWTDYTSPDLIKK
ncbi:hypothetical protein I3A86_23400, partial [Salmonella enterica]|nr:hypothetical protein [Salmonella enterica]